MAAAIQVFTNQAVWEAAAGAPIVVEEFADSALEAGVSITLGKNTPAGSIGAGKYKRRHRHPV